IAILCVIIFIQAKRADPLKRPKGLLLVAELFVEKMEGWTADNMGVRPGNWPGYFMGLFSYLFMAFIWSITGLPSVIDYLLIPFTLSLVMFTLIQFTALRYQKLSYFHRYIEPFKIWLPINLITMWTPIISTSLRMFGNCLAGSVVIGLISWTLRLLSSAIFSFMGDAGQIFLAPLPIAVLNLYFALFSGYIQTLVFASLNAVWIGQEIPSDDPMGLEAQATREGRAQ
ncbi:MAG: F0F1 ATP synthase subunit A, partial [Bacilli bacterium]|nr:F0F1 ATP synthase subunit A [Bacilli bacterium]